MTSRGRRTESDKPEGVYSTEPFADDVAAFMQALGIANAHISGLSLGAAIGMWLAAKYPKVPTQITFGRHDLLTSTRFCRSDDSCHTRLRTESYTRPWSLPGFSMLLGCRIRLLILQSKDIMKRNDADWSILGRR
jgi:hypothetical protein